MGETAGYCSGLVDGLRATGIRADFLDLADDRMGYRKPRATPGSFAAARWLVRQRRAGRRPRLFWTFAHRTAMLVLLVRAVIKYDAFVFRAGDSFFNLRDLGLLRQLGKSVVVVFFGSDSRPSYMNGAEVARGVVAQRAVAATRAKRDLVRRIERHATEVVCHVMSAQLHRRRAVSFLEVGIPSRFESVDDKPPADGRPIRIVHAPSRPEGKGTFAIRDAVERVQAAGVQVELQVITGRPNREVVDAVAGSDFVIDQLHSDTPMAAFAAEAAALGRPAIVAGYGWDELRLHARARSIAPALLCTPDSLDAAITKLATDHHYRLALGDAARRFVMERWSASAVAGRFLLLLSGATPNEWYFEPADVMYGHGAGIDAEQMRVVLRGIVGIGGPAALCVEDKPELERHLVALAGE